MPRLFLAIKFEKSREALIALIRNELSVQGVECVIGDEIARKPPPEVIRDQILACDGLFAVITKSRSDWVHNEIGIAYSAKRPVYCLSEKGAKVEGILRSICKYRSFTTIKTHTGAYELKKRLAEIVSDFKADAAVQTYGVVEITQHLSFVPNLLTSTDDHQNNLSVLVAVRPRQIPNGDEVVSIYIPPEFDLTAAANDPYRYIKTDLPIDQLIVGKNTEQDRYPNFWFVKVPLTFPEAASFLKGGWFDFRLHSVVAPTIAGTYRFYGTDQLFIEPGESVLAPPFDFPTMVVNGENTPAKLHGTLFLSKGKPLPFPGFLRAIGVAIDPRKKVSTGRNVVGVCYLSARQRGKYVLSGLAPGVYKIYAGVLGYSSTLIASDLQIIESTQLDGYVALTLNPVDFFAEDMGKLES